MTTRKLLVAGGVVALSLSYAWAQTSRPTTKPVDSNAMFNQLLGTSRQPTRPLDPLPDRPHMDAAAQKAVAPGVGQQQLIPEGTSFANRIGRLRKTADGQYEFTFDSDGQAAVDPPMLVLPNRALMQMDNMLQQLGTNLRFSVSFTVTEFGARNYMLIERVRMPFDQPLTKQQIRQVR